MKAVVERVVGGCSLSVGMLAVVERVVGGWWLFVVCGDVGGCGEGGWWLVLVQNIDSKRKMATSKITALLHE